MTLISTLGSFYFGYAMAWLNTSMRKIQTHFAWDIEEKNSIINLCTALEPFGSIIGAVLGGILATKFGRRFGIIFTDVATIIGTALCCFSLYDRSSIPLIIGRAI